MSLVVCLGRNGGLKLDVCCITCMLVRLALNFFNGCSGTGAVICLMYLENVVVAFLVQLFVQPEKLVVPSPTLT